MPLSIEVLRQSRARPLLALLARLLSDCDMGNNNKIYQPAYTFSRETEKGEGGSSPSSPAGSSLGYIRSGVGQGEVAACFITLMLKGDAERRSNPDGG